LAPCGFNLDLPFPIDVSNFLIGKNNIFPICELKIMN